ncbi:L-xylulose reductase isoform X2 [Lampetra planeri]
MGGGGGQPHGVRGRDRERLLPEPLPEPLPSPLFLLHPAASRSSSSSIIHNNSSSNSSSSSSSSSIIHNSSSSISSSSNSSSSIIHNNSSSSISSSSNSSSSIIHNNNSSSISSSSNSSSSIIHNNSSSIIHNNSNNNSSSSNNSSNIHNNNNSSNNNSNNIHSSVARPPRPAPKPISSGTRPKGSMEIRFDGKHALVTGAGKGIGRATCIALQRLGATVTALSRTQADLDSLTHECPAVRAVCVELADWGAVEAALGPVGPVDLLVNNAGVALLQPFLDVTAEAFQRSFDVNVKAVLQVSQAVARGMVARGSGGAIVNVSSQASQRALLNHTVYCASKGALDMLTKVMALELGPHKVDSASNVYLVRCVNIATAETKAVGRGAGHPPPRVPQCQPS